MFFLPDVLVLSYYPGNSAILYLQKGAQVYIQSAADVYLFGPTSEIYTTFSGHLIAS